MQGNQPWVVDGNGKHWPNKTAILAPSTMARHPYRSSPSIPSPPLRSCLDPSPLLVVARPVALALSLLSTARHSKNANHYYHYYYYYSTVRPWAEAAAAHTS